MATMRPFAALRPDPAVAAHMIALPYDVMDRAEAAAMAEGNPYSFLHIARSEIDLPASDPYAPEVYRKARETLDRWQAEGILLAEERPNYYIYRQIMDGRSQTGVVGCVSVDDYLSGGIRRHELTRLEKEQDRIRHFDICDANTEPVFLTFRDRKDLRELLVALTESTVPLYDITTPDGVRHILWSVDEDRTIQEIASLFAHIPALYIADGHHRSASAAKVGQLRRQQAPDDIGLGEFNYFMAVAIPDNDLRILGYHRVVQDLAGMDPERFLQRIRVDFHLTERNEGPREPEHPHSFSLYVDGHWYRLEPKELPRGADPIHSLDVTILQERILAPILGIKDPRTDRRIDFVGGIRGMDELERRVQNGMAAAFALYPVPVDTLLEVADQGKVMPPKSTWFEPKLASGLFIHRLSP